MKIFEIVTYFYIFESVVTTRGFPQLLTSQTINRCSGILTVV